MLRMGIIANGDVLCSTRLAFNHSEYDGDNNVYDVVRRWEMVNGWGMIKEMPNSINEVKNVSKC